MLVRVFVVTIALLLAACGESIQQAEPAVTSSSASQEIIRQELELSGCADVVDVSVEPEPGGTLEFHVTVLSADEGWDKYADEWSVRLPDGTIIGTRTLAHPHEDEQPFTRSLGGLNIPAGTTSVIVAARDSVEGYCGSEYELSVP